MRTSFFYATVMIVLSSCSQRDVIVDETSQAKDLKLDKGLNAIAFASKDDVLSFIENYEQNSDKLNELYGDGFVPFRVNDRVDEDTFNELSSKKREILYEAYAGTKFLQSNVDQSQNDDYDEEDDSFINNDKFASVLSAKGDIIVGGKVYRYTTRGLYMVDKENIEYLDDYLKDEKNNTNPLPVGLNKLNL